jgi:hypothetical protein
MALSTPLFGPNFLRHAPFSLVVQTRASYSINMCNNEAAYADDSELNAAERAQGMLQPIMIIIHVCVPDIRRKKEAEAVRCVYVLSMREKAHALLLIPSHYSRRFPFPPKNFFSPPCSPP